jgi:hypothetical protein
MMVVVGVVGVMTWQLVMTRPLWFVITGAGTVCSGIETLTCEAVVVQWLYCISIQYDL